MRNPFCWMVRILAAFLTIPASLSAATVTALVSRADGSLATNGTIYLFLATHGPNGVGRFVSSPSIQMPIATNSWASNELVTGTYRFNIDQSTRDSGVVFVPDDSNTYNLWDLITSTNLLYGNVMTMLQVGGTNVGIFPRQRLNIVPGSNTVVRATNNAASNRWDLQINTPPGGAGGGETNLLILSTVSGSENWMIDLTNSTAAKKGQMATTFSGDSNVMVSLAHSAGIGYAGWGAHMTLPGGLAASGSEWYSPGTATEDTVFYFDGSPALATASHAVLSPGQFRDHAVYIRNVNPFSSGGHLCIPMYGTNPAYGGRLVGTNDEGVVIYEHSQFGIQLDAIPDAYAVGETNQAPSYTIIGNGAFPFYISWNMQLAGEANTGQRGLMAIDTRYITNSAMPLVWGVPKQVADVWALTNVNYKWAIAVDQITGDVSITNGWIRFGTDGGEQSQQGGRLGTNMILGRAHDSGLLLNVNGNASFNAPAAEGDNSAWTFDGSQAHRLGFVAKLGSYPQLVHGDGAPFVISRSSVSDLHGTAIGSQTFTPEFTITPDGNVTIAGSQTNLGTVYIPGLIGGYTLISGPNGQIAESTVTEAELGYVDGVTSAIQTQIDGKQTGSSILSNFIAMGITNIAAADSSVTVTTNSGVLRLSASAGGTNFAGTITTNVQQFAWSWQGRDTNQVIDASKTNRVSMAPSNSTTLSFANLPSAGTPEQTIRLMIIWTNMPSGATLTWMPELIWQDGAPVILNDRTNFFDLEWRGGSNWFGFAYQGPSTGTGGTNVFNISPQFFGNPTAPTELPGDNDTSIATTAYADVAAAYGVVVLAGSGASVGSNTTDNVTTYTVSSTGSGTLSESNLIIATTGVHILDWANFNDFTVQLLTNATLVSSNVSSLTRLGYINYWQDTNGQRTVAHTVAGGLVLTNANQQPTTNANAYDILEVKRAQSTNLATWWPQNFEPRIAYTNSLAGGAAGASYLIKQGFEGAGYDNSETWTEAGSGTIDEDNTSTPLVDSQSLRITTSANTGLSEASFADRSDLWVYFQFRPEAIPAATSQMAQILNGTTEVVRIRLTSTGALEVRPAGGTAIATVSTLSATTLYHVWVHYVKGSGADGYASIAFSTDGTKPTSGNNFRESTNGTGTLDANKLRLGPGTAGSTTQDLTFDKVRADDATIGDSPE